MLFGDREASCLERWLSNTVTILDRFHCKLGCFGLMPLLCTLYVYVHMLLQPFCTPQDGNTALHEAARNGYAEVVQLLLKASCFPDGYNNKGMNSLHIAAQQGHANVVKILLKHKANTLLANKVSSRTTYYRS